MDSEDFLSHYGKKGMKWGVRKASDSSSSVGGTSASGSGKKFEDLDAEAKKALRKERAKKVAIGVGILVAVAGTAYVANQMQKNGSVKAINLSPKPKTKKAAEKILETPTDLIYLSKPYKGAGVKSMGVEQTTLGFMSKGNTKDYFEVFDNAGLNSDSFRPGHFKRMDDGSVAAYLDDAKGRRDAAGRVIPHVVFVPSSMAKDINNIDDVVNKLGPDLERRYEADLTQRRAKNT